MGFYLSCLSRLYEDSEDLSGSIGLSLVEAAGIEPASGDGLVKVSPRSACVLSLATASPTGRVSRYQPRNNLAFTFLGL